MTTSSPVTLANGLHTLCAPGTVGSDTVRLVVVLSNCVALCRGFARSAVEYSQKRHASLKAPLGWIYGVLAVYSATNLLTITRRFWHTIYRSLLEGSASFSGQCYGSAAWKSHPAPLERRIHSFIFSFYIRALHEFFTPFEVSDKIFWLKICNYSVQWGPFRRQERRSDNEARHLRDQR